MFRKIDQAKEHGAQLLCMDIDASGLPFLKNMTPPSGTKSVAELKEIMDYAGIPFLLKGIMTVRGAEKSPGGRSCPESSSPTTGAGFWIRSPTTAKVLPAIAKAVGDSMTILVDGGIRTGLDVFKALALGADAVLIGRPLCHRRLWRRGGGRLAFTLKSWPPSCGTPWRCAGCTAFQK